MSALLHLSDQRLSSLGITTAEVIDAIEHAVRTQDEGRLWTTPKSAITPGDGRYVMTTLAVGGGHNTVAQSPCCPIQCCVEHNDGDQGEGKRKKK